ncbi:MBL fold metallo-hydrolase [Streptomyces sp. NBC_00286]|uniref:MBL fold metallo-hydrolase n=1 Tax=Streptomyces sp. NBC_00286 TaxID=2975701 RepID=UPI002E27C7C6|nr:MBL fold metallo-hydrolase [Streptomyces sp. NBC_00286]
MNHLLRLTLLGVGAMNSPRFAPAGLLLRCPGHRVAFDGGPGAEPPPGRLDAWLVTDEQAELRSELRRRAVGRGVSVRAGDLELDGVRVRCCPVAHTSHPAYGYRIEAGALVVAWAPEFWEFPRWAQRADLMFAEAAGWDRPIRFRGGVGGHMCVRNVSEQAVRYGVRRLVYAHIGRPTLRAIDAGLKPPAGEWGVEGRTYTLRWEDASRWDERAAVARGSASPRRGR